MVSIIHRNERFPLDEKHNELQVGLGWTIFPLINADIDAGAIAFNAAGSLHL